MLKLFNTLTRSIEEFRPISSPNVGLYTCGPTVYNHMHIGNLRTFLFSDTLLRVLTANDYQVKFIQNITDIDDKIIKKAKEKNESIEDVTKEYTRLYFEDLMKLNIVPADNYPKATEHVGGMIKYIEKLIEKGLAYVEKDGSVYFDISQFPDYGKLSQLDKRQLKSGTRILSDEYSKEDVQDFALWKSVDAKDSVGYDSPWGRGRPGWHIECSVMSQKYLGETFDLHAGGVDLIFPHHENEIAQSQGFSDQKFANYFIHGEHILVDGTKMSKSLKNFYTLKDLEEKGFDPLALRYLVLTAHYRDKLNFTWESLQGAANALSNLRDQIREWGEPGDIDKSSFDRFKVAINEDLNTPQAVAVMWSVVKSDMESSTKGATLLAMDKVLGLRLDKYLGKTNPIIGDTEKKPKIEDLLKVHSLLPGNLISTASQYIEARQAARFNKDFSKSDEYRKKINELGLEIKDTSAGTVISSKKKDS